jgi:hypothetical protein
VWGAGVFGHRASRYAHTVTEQRYESQFINSTVLARIYGQEDRSSSSAGARLAVATPAPEVACRHAYLLYQNVYFRANCICRMLPLVK